MVQERFPLPDDQRTRCEIWTRAMGYHRPITAFNPGKQAEHAERRFFKQECQPASTIGECEQQ